MWIFIKAALLHLVLVNITLCQRLLNKKISDDVKTDILDSGSTSDAYNKFLEAYTDDEDQLLLASTDPETLRKTRKRQQQTFIKTITRCKKHNKLFSQGKSSYKMTVNSFSIMNSETRAKFLGLAGNKTIVEGGKYQSAPVLMAMSSTDSLPESWDWREKNVVTEVKNQGACGSCWAYAAIGPLEYAYKVSTGELLPLSEQELLDCTYEGQRDGCKGGHYKAAWDFIIDGNHLSAEAMYPYQGADRACSHDTHVNSLHKKIRLTGYTESPGIEKEVLRNLVNNMPLAVAMYAEDNFYSVGQGVYDGCKTSNSPNHAVVLTGYAATYFEIKNSWGIDWAINGYGRLQRGRNTCGILSTAYYIEFQDLDKSDKQEETKEAKCEDNKTECASWGLAGYCSPGSDYADYMRAYCKKTCKDCTCLDLKNECGNYAASGYCKTQYVDFMNLNCPVTCGHCGCKAGYISMKTGCEICPEGSYSLKGAASCTSCPEGETSPTGSVSPRACTSSRCQAGYYKRSGECLVCPVNTYSAAGASTCTSCPAGKTSPKGSKKASDCNAINKCTDQNQSCESWSQLGYCSTTSTYHSFMQLNCAKSCNFCKGCQDRNTKCAAWATIGYCTNFSYQVYMNANCAASCGLCKDQDAKSCAGGLTLCPDGVCRHVHMC